MSLDNKPSKPTGEVRPAAGWVCCSDRGFCSSKNPHRSINCGWRAVDSAIVCEAWGCGEPAVGYVWDDPSPGFGCSIHLKAEW